jgi:hypothetical protein
VDAEAVGEWLGLAALEVVPHAASKSIAANVATVRIRIRLGILLQSSLTGSRSRVSRMQAAVDREVSTRA